MDSSNTFDPFSQDVIFQGPDGSPIPIPMDQVVEYVQYGVRLSINYGTQIGASLILLLTLLLLTKAEKRRSVIFVVNAVTLLLTVARTILSCVYFTGAWFHPYAVFSRDYSRVPQSQFGASIAGAVISLIVFVLIEVSLILQVRVVLVTAQRLLRFWVIVFSATVAMISVGFRFAFTVVNIQAIDAAGYLGQWEWLASATNITATISICYFCVVFILKLGYTIQQRRKMNMNKFGAMQIIFIMGCQTLIIPALFSIFQYVGDNLELYSQNITIVALFLPLSAMWASTATNNRRQVSKGPDGHRKLFGGYNSSADEGQSFDSGKASTIYVHDRPKTAPTSLPSLDASIATRHDLEAQGLEGIEMKRSVF